MSSKQDGQDMGYPRIPYQVREGRKYYKRSDSWRVEYRVYRYLSHLKASELYQRLCDVFGNLMLLNEEGQISPSMPNQLTGHDWTELWTHIDEEYRMRGTGLPNGFVNDARMVKPNSSGRAKGTAELAALGINAVGKLLKYGENSWLKETFKTGRWRLSPATYYESTTLDEARRDSEMEITVSTSVFSGSNDNSEDLDESKPRRMVATRVQRTRSNTDFYLACFSRTLVYRLFDDFNADTMLVVLDEDRFRLRMLQAFSRFRPRWAGSCRCVDYLDPVLCKATPDIYYAKHFRYAYQEEFRFVWIPRPWKTQLEAVYLDLGPLDDCCALISLNASKGPGSS